MTYPVEFYYPDFIESRPDDPRISTPPRPPLTAGISTNRDLDPLGSYRNNRSSQLGRDIAMKQGRVDDDLTQANKTDARSNLMRDPTEKSNVKVNINRHTIQDARQKPTIPVTNLDDDDDDDVLPPMPSYPSSRQMNRPGLMPNDYWKRKMLADREAPITRRDGAYFGPYGLSRESSTYYYVILIVLTLLAAIFLIMTGIFYSQKFPDSNNDTGKIIGMAVCGAVFYIGIIFILIGIWHQKFLYEKSLRPVIKPEIKPPSPIYNPASVEPVTMHRSDAYLEDLDEGKERPDYAPAQFKIINEQILLQQPGAATGAGSYDDVIWPQNIEVHTEGEKPKSQTPRLVHTPLINPNNPTSKLVAKSEHVPGKTVVAQLPRVDFDNIQLKTTADDEPELPVLTKAPDTSDLIKTIAEMERQHQRRSPVSGDYSPKKTSRLPLSSLSGDLSPKKSTRLQPIDNKSSVSMPDGDESDERSDRHRHRHHRHHRHHRSHDRHHHSHSRHHHSHSKHRHHHHHHHEHRHHSHSPCPDCHPPPAPPHYHHHTHVVPLPRIVTPRHPKVITPTPIKTNTSIYRDTGINTNSETKIMKDSSVAADFEENEDVTENRIDKIPVVRRTIIVEPYPAEPSSKIVVKPRANMIGKIRLGKDTGFKGENGETIIYPTTAFTGKGSKSKKKGTMVNNHLIEDLKLDDLDDSLKRKKKNRRVLNKIPMESVAIRNAFYN